MYKELGKLKPDSKLMNIVNLERLKLSDFFSSAECPDSLKKLLAKRGYKATERNGMIFASDVGCGMHVDQEPSAIWFLGGLDTATTYGPSHELVIGGKGHQLHNGMVVWADTTTPHGVIAGNHKMWSCFSISVEPLLT